MASSNTYKVRLDFEANTQQAKKELQSLQQELSKLGQSGMSSIDKDVRSASKHAMELAANLRTATDVNTGKLNLSQFNQNMLQSGMSIAKYREQLQKLGPEGEAQFKRLAQSIIQSEVPLTKLNGLMGNLWHSFKQTAKYQFSASIYRGLIGGIQSAYSYAQDLNESLNNIRIVTGQSVEQMAKFAETANKAAQALSVTTTEYTNGALIYYQQGLDDETVKARTDVTMKLANASGVSAETASQQLTAIWNNFAKGAENLEYYADVMTALGASTASSSSEIAEGLEKFAGIANSVGLSYEYAAAALATVTATTRQSADVVGTAFKTLFARIQDLEVGETLEDGTTLGKYSQALASIGVNIKDANGDLKDMDNILDEMGSKWQNLSRDMKVAVAQTVAGTRQYTQLITLMDNWDFFNQNVDTAEGSTGTLQKQQDIYAESWEAANARVKAAAEDLYKTLINDEFFIELKNNFAGVLGFISDLIDNMNGLKGVIPGLISLFTLLFGPQLVQSMQNIGAKISDITGKTAREHAKLLNETKQQLLELQNLSGYTADEGGIGYVLENGSSVLSGNAVITTQKAYEELQHKIISNYDKMNQYEKQLADEQLKLLQLNNKIVVANDDELLQLDKKIEKEKELQAERAKTFIAPQTQIKNNNQIINSLGADITNLDTKGQITSAKSSVKETAKGIVEGAGYSAETKRAAEELLKFQGTAQKTIPLVEKLKSALEKQNQALGKINFNATKYKEQLEKAANNLDKFLTVSEQIGQLKGAGYGIGKGKVLQDDILNNIAEGPAGTKSVVDAIEKYKLLRDQGADLTQVEEKLFLALENVKNGLKGNAVYSEQAIVRQERGAQAANYEKDSIVQKLGALGEEATKKGELAGINTHLAQTSEEVAKGNEKETKGFKNKSEAFTAFVGATTGVMFAVNSLSSAFQTLSDDSANLQQKMSAVTSVLMSMPMAITALSKIWQAHAVEVTTAEGVKQVAMGKTLAAIAAQMAPFAIGAAVIIGLIAAIKAADRAYNADARAAEQAAKNARALSDAYNDVKKSYEELENTITSYQEAKDSIKELQRGTEEFDEAVKNANGHARELIEKYGAIAKYNASTGLLEIGKDELTRIEELAKKGLDNAQVQSLIAQQSVRTTQATSDRTNLLRGQKYDLNYYDYYDEATYEQARRSQEYQAEKLLNKLESEIVKLGGDFVRVYESLDDNEKAIIERLNGFDTVNKYLSDMYNGIQQNIQVQKQLVTVADTSNSLNGIKDDLKDIVVTSVAKSTEESTREYKKDIEKLVKELREDSSLKGNTNNDTLIRAYVKYMNEATGGNNYRFTKNIFGTANNIEKRGEDGGWQRIEGLADDTEQLTSYVAEQLVLTKDISEKLSGYGTKLEDVINKLQPSGLDREQIIGLIANAQNNNYDLSGLNQSQINSFTTWEDGKGYYNIYELGKAIGVLTEEVDASAYNEFAALVFDAIASRNELIANIGNSLIEPAKDAVKETVKQLGDISLDDMRAVESAFANTFKTGGVKGIDYVKNLISQSNDPIGFAKAIQDIDWSNANFDTLQDTLSQFKIGTDALRQWYDYQKEIYRNNEALTTSFDDLLKRFRDLRNIVNDIKKGGLISFEDYETLYEKGVIEQLENSPWVRTLDGWYYLGDPADLKKAVNDITLEQVNDKYTQGRIDAERAGLASQYINGYGNVGTAMAYTNRGYEPSEDVFDSFGFNKTAAAQVEKLLDIVLGEDELVEYVTRYFTDEQAKKVVDEYVNAILRVAGQKDKFSAVNQLTETLFADPELTFENVKEKFNALADELNVTGKDKAQALVNTLHLAASQSDEIDISKFEDYLDKVKELNPLLHKNEEAAIEAAHAYGVLEKQVSESGLDVDEWEEYYRTLLKTYPALKNNTQVAMEMAKANMIAANGLKSLKSNYEAWAKTLASAKETNTLDSADAVKALNEFQQALAAIMSLEQEDLNKISADFLILHYDLLVKAMEGDEEAMRALIANSMVAQKLLRENQIQDYIGLQTWIAEHPLATTLEISAYLKSVDSSLQSLVGQDSFNTLLTAAGANFVKGGWHARDIDVPGLASDTSGKGSKGANKTLKYLEDEIDRYHVIRRLLQNIEYELERVQKAKERAYGKQHLTYLDQEIGYLQEQLGLQEQYVAEIEHYMALDKGRMAAYGAQFDAYGNISNYDELFASSFAKFGNAEGEGWNDFKEAISKYEESLDLWYEQMEEKAELARKVLDAKLEGISYKVEIEVALDDREIALLEFHLKNLNDAAYDTAKAIANIGQQVNETMESIDSIKNGIEETLKTIPGITQELIDAYMAGDGSALAGLKIEQGQIDLLEEYSDQLLDLSTKLKDLQENVFDQLVSAFDAWDDKIDDHIAKFEHLNNVIDNYNTIIGLAGKNRLGITDEALREVRNQQVGNLRGVMVARRGEMENYAAALADAQTAYSAAASDAEREQWQKVIDELEPRWREATEDFQKAWIDTLQAASDAFDDTMKNIVDSFEDYSEKIKLWDAENDRYLEGYRQQYELSKLTRDIQNSINDNDSVKAKRELQKLEQKIADLRESGRKISEDELNLLQKEYELKLAEIALEDARNAKSMVRLQRDNEGNWGYMYTADEDKIAEAQQKYEDKLYEYMRLSDDMADKASRNIATVNREMAEALAALDKNAADYEEQAARIMEFYAGQLKYYEEQYGIAVDGMVNVAKASAERYAPEVVAVIEQAGNGLQTTFEDTIQHAIQGHANMEAAVTESMAGIQRAYDETKEAFAIWEQDIEGIFTDAGVPIEEFGLKHQQLVDDTKGRNQELKDETATLIETESGYWSEVLGNFESFTTKFSNAIEVLTGGNTLLAESIIALEHAMQEVDAGPLERLVPKVEAVANGIRDAFRNLSNDGGSSVDSIIDRIRTQIDNIKEDKKYFTGGYAHYDMNARPWRPEHTVQQYATGGYTGEWGTDGRLALLHQKELVLNAADTENILGAVSLIRDMNFGIAGLRNGLGNVGAGLNNLALQEGTLQQQVSIQASFPNATNHNEIEEAFNNLVNKASQYAFRPQT